MRLHTVAPPSSTTVPLIVPLASLQPVAPISGRPVVKASWLKQQQLQSAATAALVVAEGRVPLATCARAWTLDPATVLQTRSAITIGRIAVRRLRFIRFVLCRGARVPGTAFMIARRYPRALPTCFGVFSRHSGADSPFVWGSMVHAACHGMDGCAVSHGELLLWEPRPAAARRMVADTDSRPTQRGQASTSTEKL